MFFRSATDLYTNMYAPCCVTVIHMIKQYCNVTYICNYIKSTDYKIYRARYLLYGLLLTCIHTIIVTNLAISRAALFPSVFESHKHDKADAVSNEYIVYLFCKFFVRILDGVSSIDSETEIFLRPVPRSIRLGRRRCLGILRKIPSCHANPMPG